MGVERKEQSFFLDYQFGRCIKEPFECTCYDGYTGSSCEDPVCKKGCHPVNVSLHMIVESFIYPSMSYKVM